MVNGLDEWRVRLRRAVDATGKKHSYIAEEAGINPTTLSRILTGRMMPNFGTVVRLAHVCGETVGWVLGERGYCLSAEQIAKARTVAFVLDTLANDSARKSRLDRFTP